MITKFFISELYRELYPQSYLSATPLSPARIIEEMAINSSTTVDISKSKNLLGIDIEMPLKLETPDGEMWEFPVEVLVNVKGSHKRIDRYPLRGKGSGTHKERWSMDDYTVEIKGVLVDLKNGAYPEQDSLILREIMEYGQGWVECPLLRIWGIERLAYDSWDIPFTTGVPLQEFSISAKSDNLFNQLLTEV
jgi:hypothetical protein